MTPAASYIYRYPARFSRQAPRTSERISKNALVEESITFNRVNPAWDRFPTSLSAVRPVSL